MIGAPKEKDFVEEVISKLNNNSDIESIAGKTSLSQLVEWLATAQVMLSTDSGPAHLANALGTYTIVLFGAGNENNTAPFNRDFKNIIRLAQLPCEPCLKNTCEIYGIPQCLERLSVLPIVENVKHHLDNGKIFF